MYNTKATATKSAAAMMKKRGYYYSNYKCLWCDGYHIGRNNDHKLALNQQSSKQTEGQNQQGQGTPETPPGAA